MIFLFSNLIQFVTCQLIEEMGLHLILDLSICREPLRLLKAVDYLDSR